MQLTKFALLTIGALCSSAFALPSLQTPLEPEQSPDAIHPQQDQKPSELTNSLPLVKETPSAFLQKEAKTPPQTRQEGQVPIDIVPAVELKEVGTLPPNLGESPLKTKPLVVQKPRGLPINDSNHPSNLQSPDLENESTEQSPRKERIRPGVENEGDGSDRPLKHGQKDYEGILNSRNHTRIPSSSRNHTQLSPWARKRKQDKEQEQRELAEPDLETANEDLEVPQGPVVPSLVDSFGNSVDGPSSNATAEESNGQAPNQPAAFNLQKAATNAFIPQPL